MPNGLNIYDMSGNVLEWCWDRVGNYTSEAKTDPTGASSGTDRISRDGNYMSREGEYLRSVRVLHSSSGTLINTSTLRTNDRGFRIALP